MKNLIPVVTVGFSTRVSNILRRLNINTLNELAQMTERELWVTTGFGEVSLAEVKDTLLRHGMKFANDGHNN